MSDFSIRCSGLSKRYKLGERQRYKALRDVISDLPRTILNRRKKDEDRYVWALKDVNFDVRKGEVVGIIGKNGSGKSTLLKLMTRITEPTAGRAVVNGRVGALLEVGTGFHPELTGRENIFINGAILGMTRKEIESKFDAIVEFSGVEQFLDTPVKRYSSGMGVRLAFSVAAHLEPEILFVDEVLAVGDAAFQRKCLGRMNDVARDGRSILFVSHQMEAILGLCTRAIWLDRGRVQFDGSPDEAVRTYLSHVQNTSDQDFGERSDRHGTGPLRLTNIRYSDSEDRPIQAALSGQPLNILLDYVSSIDTLRQVEARIWVENSFGQRLFSLATQLTGEDFAVLPQQGTLVCTVPRVPLPPNTYKLTYVISVIGETSDKLYQAVDLEVVAADYFNSGRILRHTGQFLVDHTWSARDKNHLQELKPHE